MKITATNHETISAIATTQKMPPAYSATAEAAKPTGMNPAAVTSVPVSIGKAVMSQAAPAARVRSQPSSVFTTIISMAMIASSTSSPSAMISAPRVMRLRSIPISDITKKTIASTSGTDSATTMPVRSPSDRNETSSTIPSASANDLTNSWIECSTTTGWSAILSTVSPTGSSASIPAIAASSASPSAMMLPFSTIETPMPIDGRPSSRTRLDGGSVSPRRHRRDVAEPEHPVADRHRHRLDRRHAVERAGDPERDRGRAGLERARRRHRVLPRQAVEDRLRADPERRELHVAELDEDPLALRADQVDLVDARHAEQLLPDVLAEVLQPVERRARRRSACRGPSRRRRTRR